MSNRNSKNVWSANEIAPLEFCSLSRAARLLKCEIEDLLHWHDVGAITLCLRLPDIKGKLITETDNQKNDIFKLYLENVITLNELATVKKAWSHHSKLASILTEHKAAVKTKIKVKNHITTYETPAFAAGIWSIISRDLFDLLDSDENHYEPMVEAISPSDKILLCLFIPDDQECINKSTSNIFITKEFIEKIYHHALNGTEMPLMHGTRKLEDKNKHEKKIISPQKEKLSEFIKFLIKTNPTISKNILSTSANNRHKLFKEYIEDLRKKGIEVDYDIPSSPTLERYLKL
ncbi:hypothetical protein [Pantoea ananatis]|uniref:hypothetical protein n=1 Tax=Pantoea ananas TaxID=553 RepID=UPI00090F94D5|nr:hypothetical protein [Pantoea ananatis]SFX31371.1 hypothetical protein SAMN03097714_1545 [Pantoea ananatis]